MCFLRLIPVMAAVAMGVVPVPSSAQDRAPAAEQNAAVEMQRTTVDSAAEAIPKPTADQTPALIWRWPVKAPQLGRSPSVPAAAANSPHHFFDPLNIVLTGIEGSALMADGITTRRALDKYPGTVEADPIARLFVSHGWPGQIAGGILFVSADLGLRYALHRHGHHLLERLVPLILTVYGIEGAIHNARLLNRLGRGQ